MKSGYEYHSRFLFASYDKIQDAINKSIINENDIVICKDTNEFIYVSENFELIPIKSRVYRYTNVENANTELNKNDDTYNGQIVAILDRYGNYQGYIVNQNEQGNYYVTAMSIAEDSQIDYNNLGNRPITNLTGVIGSPVIMDEQSNGVYHVTGVYKISRNYATTFSSLSNTLFVVGHNDDGSTYVKKLGADITTYNIDVGGNVTVDAVVTKKWLSEQGYATRSYVDEKIAALDFVTQEEVENYIQSVIFQMINEQIDNKLQEKLVSVTQQEALQVFIDIFTN